MSVLSLRHSLIAVAVAALAGCASNAARDAAPADGAHARVAILETTDVHANVLSYDYYKQHEDQSIGYERLATLIRQARGEFANSFLFDSGDTIQGTVLADYQAKVRPIGCGDTLAIYAAMNAMGYDGATAGNHEFNYGLPLLSQATGTPMNVDGGRTERCAGPNFPIVLSNVYSARDATPIFKPWTVVTRDISITEADGSTRTVPLKVGIIGFTPPAILEWDKQNLEGKVTVTGVREAAQRYLPELQAQHPDLVIGVLHGGIDTRPYTSDMENGGWHLAGIDGIDAVLLGHSHAEFPGPRYAGLPEVDNVRGLVRGKPAVMGGFHGKDLGVIDLALVRRDGRWVVDTSNTHSEVRPICKAKNDCVAADPAIAPLVAKAHADAQAYVNTPIGRTEVQLSSYFTEQGNSSALAAVNAAQRDYLVRELPAVRPDLAGLPILSAAAPFRTGFGGPGDWTDVPAGELTLRNAADLYYFPNTLTAVKVDGAGLKAWLETSASRYAQIDPRKAGEQPFINTRYVPYNADQIQAPGLAYTIDVSRPQGARITALSWQGKPVRADQDFVVATNNYRANGGGSFPGLDGSSVVFAAPDGAREILAAWLEQKGTLRATDLPLRAWKFAPVAAKGPLSFACAPGKLEVARAAGVDDVRELKDNGDGTGVCAIDLSR